MKKIYTLFVSVVFAVTSLTAQVTISTAPDFTVTDIHGNSMNLYTLLNQGKHVVVDFFFVNCGPCQQSAPKFKAAYQNYGCNKGNVIFVSISDRDTDTQCQGYENTYVGAGGPPMVSGVSGGGSTVANAYMPQAFPTFILIAPNKQILEKDMWPINAATDFDPYLSSHGLSYSSCATGLQEIASPFHFEMFPNPVATQLNVESNNGSTVSSYSVYDFTGRILIQHEMGSGAEQMQVDVSTLPKGLYVAEFRTSEGLLVKKFSKE